MKKHTVWFKNTPKVLKIDRQISDQVFADNALYADKDGVGSRHSDENEVDSVITAKHYGVFINQGRKLYIYDFGVSGKALVQLDTGLVVLQNLEDTDVSLLRTPQMEQVTEKIGEITDVARIDGLLCLSTANRLYYCRIADDSIYWLGVAPEVPQPQFALAKRKVDGYSLTADALPEMVVHFSSSDNVKDVVARELKRYMQKVEREKLFAEPFFVYAALRFEDGTHGAPSPLAFMIPASQPVQMRILGETAVADGKNVAVQFVSCPCELMVRFRNVDIDKWLNFGATHIDIFASSGVAMLDVENVGSGVDRINLSGFTHSGIAVSDGDGYSFDENREEYIVGQNVVASCFDCGARSESAIYRDIVNVSDFYLAASVPIDRFADINGAGQSKFMKLDIMAGFPIASISDASTVKSYCPDYSLCDIVGAERLTPTRGGIAALAPTISYQSATDVVCMGGYWTIDGVEKVCLPRWRWCGSSATKMTLRNASQQLEQYGLVPHPVLRGCYGFDGMSSPRQVELSGETASVDVASSKEYNNYIFTNGRSTTYYFPAENRTRVGSGRVVAMSGSLKALSSGQFGEYPHYVFTTEGTWALKGEDNGVFRAVQEVNRYVVRHPDAVANMPEGVAFICNSGVYVLSGSSSKNIGNGLISLLLKDCSSASDDVWRDFLKNGKLVYNRNSDCLIAAHGSLLYAYESVSGTWRTLAWDNSDNAVEVSGVKCFIDGVDDMMLYSGNVVFGIENRNVEHDSGEWNVVTCALQTLSGKRLRAFRTLGMSSNDDFELALWGSCDMQKWIPLIRTSSSGVIPYFGPAWQFYAVGCKGASQPTGIEFYFDN